MSEPSPTPRLDAVFRGVIARRWWTVGAYALLAPVALVLALCIPKDIALERMVVASNPEVAATREFRKVFPDMPLALLVVETKEACSDPAVAALRELHASLERVPKLVPYSVLTVWERVRPGAAARAGAGDELRRFVSGTPFFRDQGLIGDGFLGVVLALDVAGPAERDRTLRAVDAAIAEVLASPTGRAGITTVRRVGAPWLDSWLEHETGAATVRFFPLFGAFVVLLTIGLYRSWRALVAILVSVAVAVLLGVAFAAVVGFGYTLVSSLVPLTLMITATASLVYLHSRFVDQAPGSDLDEHRVRALSNKLVAVSASVFAAAVGFAALAVSQIRPIRQLGIWAAVGLAIGWVVAFTLYPALQVILRAPTRQERPVAGRWVVRVATVLPGWSYRWRWPLLAGTGVLALAGLLALVGFPGLLAPMRLQTEAIDYVDPDLPVARDTRAFSEKVLGLTSVAVWITTPPGGVLEPQVIAALDDLSLRLRADPSVGSVVGLPALLRLRRYAAGQGDALPREPAELARLAADLEQLLLEEPALRQWVDMATMSSTYLTVTSRAGERGGSVALERAVRRAWERTVSSSPALDGSSYRIVGSGVLQATIAAQLVPTLTQSFAVTFAVIFTTFLLVFKSGPARLNAMVPSLFAILVMFLLMRVTGIPLNVATILIATTVLGATENDQVHFFYHFQERRSDASTEQALAHSIRVAGHAIVFATVINAGGFLALVLSSLPPMRQFGIVTSAAFALALLADFTALPAALWFFFRDRPDTAAAARS
jgi:predicted RND superfamily exporter protein